MLFISKELPGNDIKTEWTFVFICLVGRFALYTPLSRIFFLLTWKLLNVFEKVVAQQL